MRWTILFLCLLPWTLASQDIPKSLKQARDLYGKGQKEAAHQKVDSLLGVHPDHHDVLLLKSRLNAWDGKYQKAYEGIDEVFILFPQDIEAYHFLADVDYWTGNFTEGLENVRRGIKYHERDRYLERSEIRFLVALEEFEKAEVRLDTFSNHFPDDGSIKGYRHIIEANLIHQNIAARYFYDGFEDPYNDWHLGQIEYTNIQPNATWVGRVNYADRGNDRTGTQFEADVYPILDSNKYLFLSAGIAANADVFPVFRVSGEYFHVFNRGYEVSLGGGYMNFLTNKVYLITAHAARSFGNYYIDIRPYVTYSELQDWDLSGALLFRRYFDSYLHHLTLRLEAGSFTGDQNSEQEAARFGGYRGSLWYELPINTHWIGLGSLGYGQESFVPNQYVNRTMIMVGVKYRFR
ncbi:MAG: hypothetical protein SchgKO_21130 [Schleiferiaceae bacterium]